MDDCDDRSRALVGSGVPRILRENHELPVQPTQNVWQVAKNPERLVRVFPFKSLDQRSLFLEYVLEVEEKNQHFAKIIIEGLSVTIEVWTHDINSVTELDKEYASECDSIYDDVTLIRFVDYE